MRIPRSPEDDYTEPAVAARLELCERLAGRPLPHLRGAAVAPGEARGKVENLIGFAQVLALIPGTSRSGITMTAGRFLGMERPEAARFSLLLSIPTIAGAGLLAGLDIWEAGDLQLGYDAALAAGLAFVAGLASIAAMMRWLQTSGFGPFVIYRIALGALLLWWVYGSALPAPGGPAS